ncbi:MAG TPA: hypothetical protein VFH39_02040 [Candidatus Saccharimonadales bacterium]|nr:hypothetical protein [Candidatus Saccharimonadales bacterium]
MNPNVDTPPSMPMPEQFPTPPDGAAGAELAPVSAERAPQPVAVPERPPMPMVPVASTSVPMPQPANATAGEMPAVTGTPSVAADNDLIEKEGVLKAKQIVNATRQDPYQQNRQLAAIKADYMQKRYNKTVKLSE